MRRWVIAGAGALVLAAVGPATAADIPVAPIVKAPVAAPPPTQSWYGFYIGIHGGYGWGREAVTATPDAFYGPLLALAGLPLSAAGDPKGAIGGVQWGSNWQFDRIVLGTESDFSYSDIKSTQNLAGVVFGLPFNAAVEQRLKWLATTRVRGGVLMTDNVLLYATGGLASGRVESSTISTIGPPGSCALPGPCPAGSAQKDRYGWVAGGGIEMSEGPWQFRAEYLHYDLGTLTYNVFDPALPGSLIVNQVRFNGDIVRGAISYRFNWTPWELIFGRG